MADDTQPDDQMPVIIHLVPEPGDEPAPPRAALVEANGVTVWTATTGDELVRLHKMVERINAHRKMAGLKPVYLVPGDEPAPPSAALVEANGMPAWTAATDGALAQFRETTAKVEAQRELAGLESIYRTTTGGKSVVGMEQMMRDAEVWVVDPKGPGAVAAGTHALTGSATGEANAEVAEQIQLAWVDTEDQAYAGNVARLASHIEHAALGGPDVVTVYTVQKGKLVEVKAKVDGTGEYDESDYATAILTVTLPDGSTLQESWQVDGRA